MKPSPLLAALSISLGIHGAILIFPDEVGDVRPRPKKTTEVGLVYIAEPQAALPRPTPAAMRPDPVPAPSEPKAPPIKKAATKKPHRTAVIPPPKKQVAAEIAAAPEKPSTPLPSPSPPVPEALAAGALNETALTDPAPSIEPSLANPQEPAASLATTPSPKTTPPPETAPQPPRYRFNPQPDYPALAQRRHWQGEVLLRALVDAQGEVIRVALESSSGHDILDQAALKTARRWKFHPAHDGRENVPQEVCLPIRFELSKQ